jgi:DNA-binding NarL/FixJ family response regulator
LAQSFENVRLLIADPNAVVRTGLRGALFSIGFRAVSETASYLKLHDLIQDDAIDLLVTSSELEENDTGFLISEMRNQRLGSNPFLVVITLAPNAEPDYVKKVIDTGTDDLLLMPVQPGQLILRIQKLARTRKPFVVTHDYTGPDRRTKARAFEGPQAPMLEVPNPLRFRAEAKTLDGTRLARQIAESGQTMNRMKIERYAVQLDWLVNHIHACIRDGVVSDQTELAPYTHTLNTVATDMAKRMQGTPTEPHVPPVLEVLTIAKKMETAEGKVSFPELERLNTLSRTINRTLGATARAAAAPTTAPCAPAAPPEPPAAIPAAPVLAAPMGGSGVPT